MVLHKVVVGVSCVCRLVRKQNLFGQGRMGDRLWKMSGVSELVKMLRTLIFASRGEMWLKVVRKKVEWGQ